jgi:uncharacterized protein (TIGR00251 family)
VSAPAGPSDAVRAEADGLRLRVRLTPKASRDAVGRLERLADDTEVLIVHVRAAPTEGAANTALTRLLADVLDVAKSRVELVSGHTARVKTLKISGDGSELAKRLATLAATAK